MFDRNLLRLPSMGKVLIGIALGDLCIAALIIGQTLCLGFAIANLCQGAPIQDQWGLIVGFLGCFAGRYLLGFFRSLFLEVFSEKRVAELRRELLATTFLSRSVLSGSLGSASLVNTLTSGLEEVGNYIRMMPPKICGLIFLAIPLLVAEYILDWPSGIILTVTIPVIFYFMVLLGRQARSRAAEQYGDFRKLSNSFVDSLRGLSTLLSFGAQEDEERRVYDSSERLRASTMKTISVATLSSALLDLTATFGVAAVAMMLAFRLMDGSLSLSVGLTTLMLAPEFYTPLRTFAADFHSTLNAKNSLETIRDILEKEGDPIRDLPLEPWTVDSRLDLRNISYDYKTVSLEADEASPQDISDISFTVKGFEKIAIVGPSGAGKSTLISLLSGFLTPRSGTFELNGQSLRDLGVSGWIDQLHCIPQHPYLYRGTLGYNLAFYTPDAPREKVLEAARAVGLEELIGSLPDGLDTVIGDGGRQLSGGQAQRVALARALLDDKPILLFDEPTAHLDIETEWDLKKAMEPLMENRLVFFATHRHHWLGSMDRVLVLEEGTGRMEPL